MEVGDVGVAALKAETGAEGEGVREVPAGGVLVAGFAGNLAEVEQNVGRRALVGGRAQGCQRTLQVVARPGIVLALEVDDARAVEHLTEPGVAEFFRQRQRRLETGQRAVQIVAAPEHEALAVKRAELQGLVAQICAPAEGFHHADRRLGHPGLVPFDEAAQQEEFSQPRFVAELFGERHPLADPLQGRRVIVEQPQDAGGLQQTGKFLPWQRSIARPGQGLRGTPQRGFGVAALLVTRLPQQIVHFPVSLRSRRQSCPGFLGNPGGLWQRKDTDSQQQQSKTQASKQHHALLPSSFVANPDNSSLG